MPEITNRATEGETNLGEMFGRFWGIVKRHRRWILGTSFFVPIGVIAIAMKLPDHYVSQATLLVVQQQVSQRYVEPDSTTSTQAAIQAMKLEVLSRQRLLSIINDLGLYPTAGDRAPELLVERMRQEIEIVALAAEATPGRNDFNAFTISFTAGTPQLAQEVISRLTSLFIEQNQKTRGDQAANTTKFLSDRLVAARERLAQQEQHLQAFMSSNLGELPEQQQSNISALSSARARLETITSNLLQAQQQQSSVDMQLSDRLARLQTEKNALLVHYTAQYPEVMKKDREVAKLQATLERLRRNVSAETPQAAPTDDPALDAILRQAEGIAGHIAELLQQQKRLDAECEQYQKHLNLTPLRQQQLAEILRDYNLYKQDYTDLSNKKLQSQMATSLEESQEGQQFRLVDPPSLPVKPSSPKRLKIALGGLGGGVALGLVLAFLLDLRDSSFHNEKSLVQNFSLPLVLGVPLVRTPRERRARRWGTAVEFLAGSVMIIMVLAAEFYVFKNG